MKHCFACMRECVGKVTLVNLHPHGWPEKVMGKLYICADCIVDSDGYLLSSVCMDCGYELVTNRRKVVEGE